jgi:hypothetical protein
MDENFGFWSEHANSLLLEKTRIQFHQLTPNAISPIDAFPARR